jgi:Spy/CpxP family protein refolding chaperone
MAQHGPGAADSATFIQRRVDSLATRLALTDAQKTQALKIFTDANTASQALQAQIATNRTAIRDAVKKNDIAGIDAASSALGTQTGQLQAIQAKADAAFYNLLTADQKTKYDSAQERGPGRGGYPGMRRPGGEPR